MLYVSAYEGNTFAFSLYGGTDVMPRLHQRPPALTSLHPDMLLEVSR
jgi:hypothetical protein